MKAATYANGAGIWRAEITGLPAIAWNDEYALIKKAKKKAKRAIAHEIVERLSPALTPKDLAPVRVYLSDVERAPTGVIRSLTFAEK